MVTNVAESPTKESIEIKYAEQAQKTSEQIESKKEVAEKSKEYYQSATRSMEARRLLLAETIQLAAEISEGLQQQATDHEFISESWQALAETLGHPNLTLEISKQETQATKLDVADIIEQIDVISLVDQLIDPTQIAGIQTTAYENTGEALAGYSVRSIQSLFAIRDLGTTMGPELYYIGLGIEDLKAREMAIEMLSGYAETQKENKIERLTKKPKVATVGDDTIGDLFSGKVQNSNPRVFR